MILNNDKHLDYKTDYKREEWMEKNEDQIRVDIGTVIESCEHFGGDGIQKLCTSIP